MIAGHANGLYIIAHVGSNVLSEAVELAAHAASIGADAIASVPPYATKRRPSTCSSSWLLHHLLIHGFFFFIASSSSSLLLLLRLQEDLFVMM